MKAATVHELKQELSELSQKKLVDLCLRLARFKKENKELISFILFESHNVQGYIEGIKQEMDEQFDGLNKSNWFLAKKGLRKIIRIINRHSKQIGSKEADTEMVLHFCERMKQSGINYTRYKALQNIYDSQLKKLHKLVETIHEDLRYDYRRKMDEL